MKAQPKIPAPQETVAAPATPRKPAPVKAVRPLKALALLTLRRLRNLTSSLLVSLAERLSSENRERLRQSARLLDVSPDAIFTMDRTGAIRFWNRNAAKLFGWKPNEAQSRDAYVLLFPNGRERLESAISRLEAGREVEMELQESSRDGKPMTLVVRVTLVAGGRGEEDLILVHCRDVTGLKEREAGRLRSERLQSIGTLASGVAHDVNNALLPILFGAEMLQQNPDDPRRNEYIAQVLRNAERVQSIMRQIQLFVGNIRVPSKHVDVGQVLRDTDQIIRHTFPKGLQVRSRISQGLWHVAGEEQQIAQIIMNLALNSRDAMGDQGTLTVTAENVQVDAIQASQQPNAKAGPHVLITVEDTGTGIDTAILDKIFDPFFTTKQAGAGLGLSTALGIVRAHGGFLTLSTQVSKGTVVKIWLPAVEGPDPSQLADPFPIPRGEGETILVIDDEESVRTMAKQALESWGYRVITADDGTGGVTMLTRHRDEIRAVLCDMMMPVMDGPATIRALHKIRPDVPVLAMSGLIEDMAKNAKEAGAAVLLQKPFTAKTLLKTVALFVRQERAVR